MRKAKGLVECAARVTVVSPVFVPGFDMLPDVERVTALYAQTHMARKMWRLVFAATDSPAVNAQVQKHAVATGYLCCRVDEPDEGDFSSGATARVGATRKADVRGVQAAGNVGVFLVPLLPEQPLALSKVAPPSFLMTAPSSTSRDSSASQ